MPSRLPLFPLKIVLFPGALLPLHIFEPRYRQLLADVTLGDHRFGLLPPGERGGLPGPGTVGCVALVRAVQPLGDGRSNIVVSGERRFALLEPVPAESPYPQGLVEWVEDTPDVQIPTDDEVTRLRGLGERYARALQALNDQPLSLELPTGYRELSFEAAARPGARGRFPGGGAGCGGGGRSPASAFSRSAPRPSGWRGSSGRFPCWSRRRSDARRCTRGPGTTGTGADRQGVVSGKGVED